MHPLEKIKSNNWPPIIDSIAQIIGDDAALKMFIRFAGRHLAIPTTILPDNDINKIIGEEKYAVLIKIFGGEQILFPNGKLLLINVRNNEIVNDFLSGMKQCDIATKYGLTERHINTIINKHKDKNNPTPNESRRSDL